MIHVLVSPSTEGGLETENEEIKYTMHEKTAVEITVKQILKVGIEITVKQILKVGIETVFVWTNHGLSHEAN